MYMKSTYSKVTQSCPKCFLLIPNNNQYVMHSSIVLGHMLYWQPTGQKVGAKNDFSMSAFGIEPQQYRYPYQELSQLRFVVWGVFFRKSTVCPCILFDIILRIELRLYSSSGLFYESLFFFARPLIT